MFNKQTIAREINEIEKLISAITVEMPKPHEKQEQLRAEMTAAIEQLRLARGVRLMLLNAYNMKVYRQTSHPLQDDKRAA